MKNILINENILLINHKDLIPDIVINCLNRSGHDFDCCETDSDVDFSDLTVENKPLIAIWVIKSYSNEIKKSLETVCNLNSSRTIIVSESYSKDDEIDALRKGALSYIQLNEIDSRLDPTVNKLLKSHLLDFKEKYIQNIETLNGGLVQGCARLLHDVNSPLSAIQNAFEMIEMHHEAMGKPLDDKLMILRSGLVSSAQIVQKWHKFLYVQPVYNDDVNIFQALKQSINIVNPQDSKIEFRCEPESLFTTSMTQFPDLTIKGNSFNVTQIFYYILQNAIEAIEDQKNQIIEIKVKDNHTSIDVDIADNGAGIKPELVSTIWKDFVTDKGEGHPGLGIGIARYLLMLHAGSISYSNSNLPGASFRLSFRKR